MFKVHEYILAKKNFSVPLWSAFAEKVQIWTFLTKLVRNFPSILNLRIFRSLLNIAPMAFYQKTDPT